jgi:streptogramin lyase
VKNVLILQLINFRVRWEVQTDVVTYCNMDSESVAKQRLGKQTSTLERYFSNVVRTAAVAMQWFGKHVWTTEDGVFRKARTEELS